MKPSTAMRLAKRNGVSLPSRFFGPENTYKWGSFEDFLQVYNSLGHVIRTPDDLYYLTERYLQECASEGTLYVEFMLSPAHSLASGISFDAQVRAVSDAISDANSNFGIDAGLIITCVRHRGPEEALEIAEFAADSGNSSIVGFGLTGNERLFDASEFAGAFMIADSAGLGLTAHAGEWMGAESVLHTVNELGVSRIGHGIRVAENKTITAELAARGIGFEICLSSNVFLGVSENYENHPFSSLMDAGCKVSLATDDPAYFSTTPINEYRLAVERGGVRKTDINKILNDSISMSFCEDSIKQRLKRKISDSVTE